MFLKEREGSSPSSKDLQGRTAGHQGSQEKTLGVTEEDTQE